MIFTITNKSKDSLENVLKSMHIPKKEMHWLRMSKDIKINDESKTIRDLVHQGDSVYLPDFSNKSSYEKSSQYANIQYEDDYLAVVIKPHRQKTHPNNNETDTLMNDAINTVQSNYLEPIHRIDFETKGMVILAKNSYVKKMLDYMIEHNEIVREYTAYVSRPNNLKVGDISLPIKQARHSNHQEVNRRGKDALTHILSIEDNKVILQLSTGRTHQIRVHLSHLGAPIIGDNIYGGEKSEELQLFASRIQFIHPVTKDTLNIKM